MMDNHRFRISALPQNDETVPNTAQKKTRRASAASLKQSLNSVTN